MLVYLYEVRNKNLQCHQAAGFHSRVSAVCVSSYLKSLYKDVFCLFLLNANISDYNYLVVSNEYDKNLTYLTLSDHMNTFTPTMSDNRTSTPESQPSYTAPLNGVVVDVDVDP